MASNPPVGLVESLAVHVDVLPHGVQRECYHGLAIIPNFSTEELATQH